MNRRQSGPLDTVRTVVTVVRSDQITFIAASLAYYAFISLLPLLLLTVVAVSVVGGPELAATLGTAAANSFGQQAGALVESALVNAAGRGGATVIGTALLVWSALKLFRGLKVAFTTIYGTVDEQSMFDQLRDGFVALVGVGLGVAATVIVGFVVARVDRSIVGVDMANVAGTGLLVLGLLFVFLPLYYVLPDRGVVTVREAVPGALVAAVGWAGLQVGFRIYAEQAATYQAYGVLGGVLLLVTFLYIGGIILLVGVVVNAVLAGRIDDESDLLDPDAHGTGGRGLSATGTTTLDVSEDADERGERDSCDEEIRELRERLAEFEDEVEERTVKRDDLERDLKRYVRRKVRSGKARGWGPYLVLLYGTVMTLGAFTQLSGGWAVLAMLVIWLSTLGLYALMLIVSGGLSAAQLPFKLRDTVADRRK
ncbi:YihY family inner membrane protein [Halosegnis rubeus]|jgi:YihY family inner membrane protein|uniref:YihY family inner membrane protein n=1 Tax=Halosegnis rubeus TaxID=2212850 RepID=A0A5N5U293_9EURY|nr:YihY/virulence factor BrkB family protein [Halosegnis rubeus]KAB7512529.1 YihY family inner membrane protein [Halosegnis rubeus]